MDNIMSCEFNVVTGDANGADKAMQRYLADNDYENVIIYYVGEAPRNNIGNWPKKRVEVPSTARGRDFYAQKDKFMASLADFGLVLWDGKSPGSVQNMIWLTNNQKKGLVFHNPSKTFTKIKELEDLKFVFGLAEESDLVEIDRKIGLPEFFREGAKKQHQFDL
ncbi:hypothetical protein DVR09_11600 [Erythrobacter aureus]|uniref:Uncharacterized protein n=1 Tax=Erythrobacter aureus TaxID=2182384 RepID=A0A345YG36_9SPHN|nr:hypothetical protein DVR09_11600 [Erythrobacter aureus]